LPGRITLDHRRLHHAAHARLILAARNQCSSYRGPDADLDSRWLESRWSGRHGLRYICRPDPCLQTGSRSGIQTLSRPYVCVELGPHGSMGIGGLVVAQPRVTRVATTLGASRASLAGRRTDPQNVLIMIFNFVLVSLLQISIWYIVWGLPDVRHGTRLETQKNWDYLNQNNLDFKLIKLVQDPNPTIYGVTPSRKSCAPALRSKCAR
jgi:hypothetical protein